MQPPDDDSDIAAALERSIAQAGPDVRGPVQVLKSTTTTSGETDYEISASRLIPLDPDDPDVADVYVPVPVTGHVALAPDGASHGTHVDDVDEGIAREVRSWARSLIASGSVAGVKASGPAYGPPPRPTHELVVDDYGRRIIRRIGFAIA